MLCFLLERIIMDVSRVSFSKKTKIVVNYINK